MINIQSKLASLLATIAMIVIHSGCSEQNFSGGSGSKEVKTEKKPHATIDPNKSTNSHDQDGLSTDNGGIAGTTVSRVGIGFEDIGGSATDHNDAYLCFVGNFVVDEKTYEITSSKDQNNVLATWGNLAAIPHQINITITDSSGKETYNKNFQGIKHAALIQVIPLSFTMGSKLMVTMDGSVKHTMVGPGAYSSEVALNRCNSTGN